MRAVYFLMAELETVNGDAWRGPSDPDAPDVAQAVQIVGPGVVRKHYENEPVTCQQVQEALLAWLCSERWFPHHTIEAIPKDCALALPGSNGPAAGWLLPRTSTVQRVPGGVLDRGVLFRTDRFDDEMCETPWKREFPGYYPGQSAGIFVERSDSSHLYYLTPGT
jgi:hypothetical protein